jgi:hypothetical protein
MEKRARSVANVILALFAMSCGGSPEPGQPTVQSISRDLALGARGSDVEAVNNYLTQYGYFPNQDLQSQYPMWRPIVPPLKIPSTTARETSASAPTDPCG